MRQHQLSILHIPALILLAGSAAMAQQSLVYEGPSYSRTVFPSGPYRASQGPLPDHRFTMPGNSEQYNFRGKSATSYDIDEDGNLRRWSSDDAGTTQSQTWERGTGMNVHRKF